MKKTWLLIVLLSAFYWSAGQSYVNYSEKDGLPSNHVYKITQDVDGFIWIATDEGLVKYNGSEFKIFTTRDGLPTNDIWNIFPGNDGKLWYIAKSTSMGYILHDQVHDFKNVDEDITMDPIYTGFTGDQLIPSGTFHSYLLNDENQWEQQEFENTDHKVLISSVIHKDFNKLSSSQANSGRITAITPENKTHTFVDSITRIDSYSRGQLTDSLYVINNKMSYNYVDLNNLKLKQYSYENELGVTSLKYARIHLANNRIQFTGEHVVTFLNNELKPESLIHIPKELNSHYSFIDKENTVWIATFNSGIYKHALNEKNITTELDTYKIKDIKYVDNDVIALVEEKGFYKYNEGLKTFESFIDNNHFLYDAIYLPQTNSSYFFTKKNIYTITDGKQINHEFNVVNESARSLDYHDGYLYSHFTAGIKRLAPYSLEELESWYLGSARCEVSFKDELIVGVSNGLYQLENEKFEKIPALANFDKPVIDLKTINDHQMLVSTSGYGIYLTDLETIELLDGSEFLKANNPFFQDNQLYVPTNQGIYHYEYVDQTFLLRNRWNNTNGLPTHKINGVLKLDDKLMIATNKGIIHLPIDYKSEQGLLDLYIESGNYQEENLTQNNTVTYSENTVTRFVVKSLDYRNNQNLHYDFKLAPNQTDWVTTNSSNLSFSDLGPGSYQLQLRGENVTKSIDFTIEPKWYQAWWFYILSLLSLITAVVFITKYLTKKSQEKKNKELLQSQKLSELQLKALRSQMNPHFVFNSLTAIQYYINENDFETSDKYLVKFSRLVREFFELSKEQYITVEREIELLKNYLDLEKLRFKSKLSYEIIVDPVLDIHDKLPSMLLQPIVENAVNHGIFNKSTAGKVIVKFKRLDKDRIKIHIIDDGVGMKFNKDDNRYKSSSVLDDRLKYLRASGLWEIQLQRAAASQDATHPGHEVIFDLKKINNENL
ncbi:MAG: histidine kinase [Nonlabens sp.]|uniref:sensor histidine kinase n=1 Tax=Nonlabens sp. TaxID=1888209 RepID=UPI003EF59CBC